MFAALTALTGCATSKDGGHGGVFPCVWSDNGFALYPLYYHSVSDGGRDETCWMLCGLTGYKEHRGSNVSDWLVPIYARGSGWFCSALYADFDGGRKGRDQYYLMGLGGRIVGEYGVTEHSWVFPFFYRNPELFASIFYGSSKDSEWVFPFYYRSDRWFANLLYASKNDAETGETGFAVPLCLTYGDDDGKGNSDFYSPLFGWHGAGSVQTNSWWATPLIGTRSGRKDGWWAFPLVNVSRDAAFEAKRNVVDSDVIPAEIMFQETELTDAIGGLSKAIAQKGSMRADDEITLLLSLEWSRHIYDRFDAKDGRYKITVRDECGNRFIVGSESNHTVVYDTSTREKISEHEKSCFSLFWRLFRYENDSAEGMSIDMLFVPVYPKFWW